VAWTTPRDWSVGEVVTAAMLNSNLRDNLDYLFSPPSVGAYRSTDQTGIGSGTWTDVTFGQHDWNVGGMHDTSTNPEQFGGAGPLGVYTFKCGVVWDTSTAGAYRGLRVINSGGTVLAVSRVPPLAAGAGQSITVDWQKTAGSGYVKCQVNQDSGANRTINQADRQIYGQLTWLTNGA
jgi:hypothetical protein